MARFQDGKILPSLYDYFSALTTEIGLGMNQLMPENSFVRLPLIEDNDDDDQYPDTMNEMRTMGYNIQTAWRSGWRVSW